VACTLLGRAVRHHNETEARKVKSKVAELAAASAATYKTPKAAEVATPERHYTPVDDDQDAASGRDSDSDAADDNDGGGAFLSCLRPYVYHHKCSVNVVSINIRELALYSNNLLHITSYILQTPQFWAIRAGTQTQGEREQECEVRTDGF